VIFSLVIGPLSVGLGITAMRKARREGTLRPRGAIAGTIFGSLAAVLGVAYLAAFALFSTQLTQYSRCLASAQTISAQQACSSQFYKSIDNGFGLGGSG
jgi:hypothetical protein